MHKTILLLAISIGFFFLFNTTISDSSEKNENCDKQYLYKKYIALVVGIGKYENWPVLPNAEKDAKDIARILKHSGFSVNLRINPDSKQLKKAFNELIVRGQDTDCGVFLYYVGNGETRILADNTSLGYIIPRGCPGFKDDPAGFEENAISIKDIEILSLKIRSKHVMMIFDSSFDGTVFTLKKPSLKNIDIESFKPIRQFIIAGKANESVHTKGIFKKNFVKGLTGSADFIHDGCITGSELGLFLANMVKSASKGKQHPQYGIINNPVLSKGDFIFKTVKEIPDICELHVNTNPENAKVRVLNIKPRFKNGMKLKPGKYHLEVSAKNYEKQKKWIELMEGKFEPVQIKLKKIKPVLINSIGMKLVYIPSGSFFMGSPHDDRYKSDDEFYHKVTLTKSFYMQAREVTVSQFRQFIRATGYKTEIEKENYGCWIKKKRKRWEKNIAGSWRMPISWETDSFPQTGNHPVTCVTWNDATEFVKWLSKSEGKAYQLPTEAEWEYACRAGTNTSFAFGNCLSLEQANFDNHEKKVKGCSGYSGSSPQKPVFTGSLIANPWELCDMHGNVSEWCMDRYGNYSTDGVKDPIGPSEGLDRVIRGGHWAGSMIQCRSASRGSFRQNAASDVIGFRVVMRR